MSWRTIVISNRAKLDFKMNYMTVRNDQETTRIFINEIYMVIIESTAVSITGALLSELTKKKVKVIFCDEKEIHHLNCYHITVHMIQVQNIETN